MKNAPIGALGRIGFSSSQPHTGSEVAQLLYSLTRLSFYRR